MTDDVKHDTIAREDWAQKVQDRATNLSNLADRGERYSAFACDRIGEVNRELIAINKAGWELHSIVPFVFLSDSTTDHMSYFCVIAEKRS